MLELLDHSENTTLLTPIRALELRLLVENIRPTSVKDTIPDVAPFTGVPPHTQGPSNDTNAVRDPLTASTETTTPDDPPTPADVDAVTFCPMPEAQFAAQALGVHAVSGAEPASMLWDR